MRHRHHGKKLNRSSSHRKALRMNLATQLLTHGRIKTTFHKAKFVQGHAERLITIAKRGLAKAEAKGDDLIAVHARRQVARRLNNNRVPGWQGFQRAGAALRRTSRRLYPHPEAGAAQGR